MKKYLLYAAVALAAACDNNDEDRQQECTNRLWELTSTCSTVEPGQPENCVYFATYGESEQSAGTVEVDASTFDHYTALGNPNDGSLCWEGTQ
ncbi:MAG TPA: hypothetical protein VF676_12385 [Flavobacterium sp.]|jgi:hypothetical protein